MGLTGVQAKKAGECTETEKGSEQQRYAEQLYDSSRKEKTSKPRARKMAE